MLAEVVKCTLSVKRSNALKRAWEQTRKTLRKERNSLTIIMLNGLRATKDGMQAINGFSSVNANRGIL